MALTKDGHNLLVGDKCLKVSFEDDSPFIKDVARCIYMGSELRDNRPFLDSLSPGCSGSPMPEFQTIHCFADISDPNTKFYLSEGEIKCSIIKDESSVRTVSKLEFKS